MLPAYLIHHATHRSGEKASLVNLGLRLADCQQQHCGRIIQWHMYLPHNATSQQDFSQVSWLVFSGSVALLFDKDHGAHMRHTACQVPTVSDRYMCWCCNCLTNALCTVAMPETQASDLLKAKQ